MTEKTKKQVLKLHKSFLEEIHGCDAMERQGYQGLSSMANIATRLPLVLPPAQYGVLTVMRDADTLLTQRHFEGLEKARLAVAQTTEYFCDNVENMQRLMSTCSDVFDGLTLSPATVFLSELMEWMENVLAMYEREYPLRRPPPLARKKTLLKDLGFADVRALNDKLAQYLSSSPFGAVNRDYGTSKPALALPPPPLVTLVTDAAKAKRAQAAKHKELPEDDASD
ncbi:hypothetical protein ACHHYP_01797 [Achlya hypogyna]|uniref:Uncharacterized protein n=1 Tax=Achlya hypogyna TaxID=1202772 RepID=A0A1V9ZT34_ACHHY|nr:hypothetical protein ACHHYP_01797 [Achlya hypogyna]